MTLSTYGLCHGLRGAMTTSSIRLDPVSESGAAVIAGGERRVADGVRGFRVPDQAGAVRRIGEGRGAAGTSGSWLEVSCAVAGKVNRINADCVLAMHNFFVEFALAAICSLSITLNSRTAC